MRQRRATGALEAAVLAQVWSQPAGLTPRQVLEGLDTELAYTTVMTIMNRLWTKGLLERQRDGRAFRYTPVLSEPELVATRMTKALDVATDREATLSRFVQELSEGDEALLRAVLDGDS